MILQSNRYEKERILKEERDRIANNVVEEYKIEQIYTLQKEEKDLKKMQEIDKEKRNRGEKIGKKNEKKAGKKIEEARRKKKNERNNEIKKKNGRKSRR